jgi:hypothetical protein
MWARSRSWSAHGFFLRRTAAVLTIEGTRGAVGLPQLFVAVTLVDGRVVIVNESTATVWDPRDDSITEAGSLIHPRSDATVTLLADGRVLVVGGNVFIGPDVTGDPVLEVELWDPATLSFSVAGTLDGIRIHHTTTAMPDGRALIVGGNFGPFGRTPLQPIEVWEPARG